MCVVGVGVEQKRERVGAVGSWTLCSLQPSAASLSVISMALGRIDGVADTQTATHKRASPAQPCRGSEGV